MYIFFSLHKYSIDFFFKCKKYRFFFSTFHLYLCPKVPLPFSITFEHAPFEKYDHVIVLFAILPVVCVRLKPLIYMRRLHGHVIVGHIPPFKIDVGKSSWRPIVFYDFLLADHYSWSNVCSPKWFFSTILNYFLMAEQLVKWFCEKTNENNFWQ